MKKEDNPFILTDSRKIYKNPWIDVREDSVIRPGGKPGIFGVVEMKPVISVVALDAGGYIYLAYEYKYALEKHCLSCVTGGTEQGEDPLSAARRELREEIGGVSDDWIPLGSVYAAGIVVGVSHLFLAKNTELKHLQDTDEGEVIEIVRMPFAEAYQKVQSGEIIHAPSVAAILKTYILLNM